MSPLVLETLKESESPVRAIWILLCAIDGMPDEEIKGMKTFSITDIQNRRQEFLSEKFSSFSELQQKVDSLHGQVKKELEESRDVRTSLEQGIERAWAAQREAQDQLMKSKDEMIGMLRGQLKELKEQIRHQIELANEEKQEQVPEKSGSEEYERKVEEMDMVISELSSKDVFDAEIQKRNHQNRMVQFFLMMQKKDDAKKFVARYLDSEEFSEEQKEYFLSCLENGISLRDIKKFATPGLTVEQMERLRKIQGIS